jgi:lysophospholipase L1-like esterase
MRMKKRAAMRKRTRTALAAGVLGIGWLAGHAQTPPISAGSAPKRAAASVFAGSRWEASLAAFAEQDRREAPPAGGVLFVGSSSIRLWGDLEKQFDQKPCVVKRGFGGSRMSDVAQYLGQIVLPYKPRVVLVYAGDNDLAEGASPHQVLQSFQSFVQGVREALPDTRIAYISIKPSPLRRSVLPAARETNELIRQYTAHEPNMDYIDVYTPMLDAHGEPRRELFLDDSLHLNAEGYSLWKRVISAHLHD